MATCTINLISPADKLYTTNTSMAFNYNHSGNLSGASCTLYFINGSSTTTNNMSFNESLPNNTMTNVTIPLINSLNYKWYWKCFNNDTGTHNCTSAIRDLQVGSMNYKGIDTIDKATGDVSNIFGGNMLNVVVNLGVFAIFIAALAFITNFMNFRTWLFGRVGLG